MSVPTATELQQLAEVVKFRSQLASQGLTATYPSHAEFGDHVRGGLLRAIRDILSETVPLPIAATRAPVPPAVDTASREVALQLAKEYDQIRRTMSAGDERTRIMEGVFSRMKITAPKVQGSLSAFQQSGSAGERLMAVAVLDMFPEANQLAWLAERLDPEQEKPFVAYHAAVALLDAVTNLPSEDCAKLEVALAEAKRLALRLKGDPARLNVLARAEEELARKCQHAKG